MHWCHDPLVSKERVVGLKKERKQQHLSRSTFCKGRTIRRRRISQITDNSKKNVFRQHIRLGLKRIRLYNPLWLTGLKAPTN